MFDLGGGHLAVVVMVQIAVDAAFVAAIGNIELNSHRNIEAQGLRLQLHHQLAHRTPPADGAVTIGCSDTSRIPWLASSRARISASCSASCGATSNSGQILCLTISSSGVAPSAACQMMVA